MAHVTVVSSVVNTLPLKEAIQSLSLPGMNQNLFLSTDWFRVLDRTYNLNFFVKFIKRGGKVDSYIVYSVVRNFLEWKICICSYCDYCDCHVTSLEDWNEFFKSLRFEYPHYRIAIRNLRDDILKQSPDFQVLSKERFHILDIRDPLELVWKRTHDSFKSAVKQGQKNNMVIDVCDKSRLPDFFQMHLSLRKDKYRLFAQPYRFFENIWDQYMEQNNGVLLGAFDPDGRLIAANIYLICADTMYYKFNTSSIDSLKLRPNNILFWEGIKLAKERNLKFMDLGSSGCHQDGLILYKNHTGAQMFDITHLGFAPPGYKFSQKRILKTFTQFCTRPNMPEIVSRIGSNIIYPFLA
jgi:hypothetical protein